MNEKKETTLLDSSLNTGRFLDIPNIKSRINYTIKVIDCNEYKQIYIYPDVKSHIIGGFEQDNLRIRKIGSSESISHDPINSKIGIDNEVQFKNVIRSKLKLQRLAKANADVWKTFITLTFKENINDLSMAYNEFRKFIKRINRVKKEFKWLCVPEFQKNGRVHYHLISNIDINDKNLIYFQKQENDIIYYHLKHWSKNIINNEPIGLGFDKVELIQDQDGNDTKKICGYISKYMTKSYIENAFFNHNRYYSSQNLIRPKEILIELGNDNSIQVLSDIFQNYNKIYENDYYDNFNERIKFIEFLK